MELGGREILIALGALLVVAILLDGFRRVRRAGEGKLRVRRRKQPIFEDDDFDEFGSELPGGGARVVAFRDEDDAEQLSQTIKANRECDPSRLTSPFRQSGQTVTQATDNSPSFDAASAEENEDLLAPAAVDASVAVESSVEQGATSELGSSTELDNTLETSEPVESQYSLFDEPDETLNKDSDIQENFVAPVSDGRRETKPAGKKPRKSRASKDKRGRGRASQNKASEDAANKARSADIADEDVIILHLMAEQGEVFQGDDLLKALIDNGLRYGSLKIFHRHEREDGTGDILFSMANSVNPGTFELNSMGEFQTPGVTFMMVLADSEDPLNTFDLMLACIHGVHSAIGGELKDQQRSALSQQTAEHYRQRIMDFNRRRLTASA